MLKLYVIYAKSIRYNSKSSLQTQITLGEITNHFTNLKATFSMTKHIFFFIEKNKDGAKKKLLADSLCTP